jgi:hypothetical protein
MMTLRSVTLGFVLVFSLTSFGQIVPSDCNTQDTVKKLYKRDAIYLSCQEISRQGYDSILFPDSMVEKKLRALLAVYNVQGIPEADTVAHRIKIHAYHATEQDEILLYAKKDLFWMQNLKKGQLPCGNTALDSILAHYGIQKYTYDSISVFSFHSVVFYPPVPLNTLALAKVIDQLPDLEALSYYIFGDGNRLQDSVFDDHIELTYSYGWGDCPSGCGYRRFWKFKVYNDCSVEFVGSSGKTLPTLSVPVTLEKEIWQVYPNPFTKTLEISEISEPCEYVLYSLDGRLVKQGSLDGNQITDLDILPKGLYFLHLQVRESAKVFRIHKE